MLLTINHVMEISLRPSNLAVLQPNLLENLVGYNLRRGYFIAGQIFSETFSAHGITPIQFAILETISADERLSQKEVAANIGSSPQVIVSLVRDLETRELVGRVRSEADRRQHHLALTDDGWALLNELRVQIPLVEDGLLLDFTADEKKTLLRLLNKLVDGHERS